MPTNKALAVIGAASHSHRRCRTRLLLVFALTAAGFGALSPVAGASHPSFRVALVYGSYRDAPARSYTLDQLRQGAVEMEEFFDRLTYGSVNVTFAVADAPGLGASSRADNGQSLLDDAAEAAAAGGFSFAGFDGIGVIGPRDRCGDVYGGEVGASGPRVRGRFHLARLFDCVNPANTPDPSGVEWGPWAHEVVHMLQAHSGHDGHPANYADGHNLLDSCYPCGEGVFGLSGTPVNNTRRGSIPGVLDPREVRTVALPPTGRAATETTIATLGTQLRQFHTPKGIKVPLPGAPGRYYLIEARKRVGADAYGAATPRLAREGVHVHSVDEARDPPVVGVWACNTTEPQGCIANARTDPRAANCRSAEADPPFCYPFALWQGGQTFRDDLNDVSIRVNGPTVSGYSVTVDRARPPARPDVWIMPWRTPPLSTFETVDLWVDSSCNGYGSYRYGRNSDGTITGNGDDLCANHANRVYAKVRNNGDAPARNVVVQIFATQPTGTYLGTPRQILLDTVTATDFASLREIAPNASVDVYANWRAPDRRLIGRYRTRGFSISAQLGRVDGEISISNNTDPAVRENLDQIEVVDDQREPEEVLDQTLLLIPQLFGSAPSEAVVQSTVIRGAKGLGLTVNNDRAVVTTSAKRAQALAVRVDVPAGAVGKTFLAEVEAGTQRTLVNPAIVAVVPPKLQAPAATGDPIVTTPKEHREFKIFGQAALALHVVRPSAISVSARRVDGSALRVSGQVRPQQKATVAVDVFTDPKRFRTRIVRTDRKGRFALRVADPLKRYQLVQAFWQGDRDSARAISKTVRPAG